MTPKPNVPATAAEAVRQATVALRILAVLQASGTLDAANLAEASEEIEAALAVLERIATPRPFGNRTIPVLTLAEVAARAERRRAHLTLVEGGAA